MFQATFPIEDLWPGEMRGVQLGDRHVLIINSEGRIVAYEDRCPHLGVRLSKGKLQFPKLTCSAHQYEFDVRTGMGINPESCRLSHLPCRVVGGMIEVGNADDAIH